MGCPIKDMCYAYRVAIMEGDKAFVGICDEDDSWILCDLFMRCGSQNMGDNERVYCTIKHYLRYPPMRSWGDS